MNRKAVYPGTFDPVTHGHIDIIERASRVFDHVFVGVAHSHDKKPLFSITERLDMIKQATEHLPNVKVEDFSGLVIEYVKKKKSMVKVHPHGPTVKSTKANGKTTNSTAKQSSLMLKEIKNKDSGKTVKGSVG